MGTAAIFFKILQIFVFLRELRVLAILAISFFVCLNLVFFFFFCVFFVVYFLLFLYLVYVLFRMYVLYLIVALLCVICVPYLFSFMLFHVRIAHRTYFSLHHSYLKQILRACVLHFPTGEKLSTQKDVRKLLF